MQKKKDQENIENDPTFYAKRLREKKMIEMQADENRKNERLMSNDLNAIEMDPPDFTVYFFNLILKSDKGESSDKADKKNEI